MKATTRTNGGIGVPITVSVISYLQDKVERYWWLYRSGAGHGYWNDANSAESELKEALEELSKQRRGSQEPSP